MRIAVVMLVGLAASAGITVRSASSIQPPTVPCGDVIHHTTFPYLGDPGAGFRYRLVLRVVSVPPRYLRQVVPTHSSPWRYWRKAGLVVQAGAVPVVVSVPPRWRSRAAITWGNNIPIVESLRIAGCGSNAAVGNAYAGGFYLRDRAACIPITFRLGKRIQTVHFGIGRRC